jgi:predicted extracellular nuclease
MKSYLLALLALCNALLLSAQTDIQDLRDNYAVGQIVTITGIVTNGEEMGSSVRYIQDESAGIAIYSADTETSLPWEGFVTPSRGDEITVTGEI